MKYSKFSHKTPHLKGKQHQLDPNLDLKHLVHHASVEFVDRDADGDVDVYDNPKKSISDENPVANFGKVSKELIKKQKGELKHTKRGVAYEDLRKWFSKSHPEGNWKRYNTKGEAIGPCAREPGESKPKCLSNEKAAKMSKDKIAAAVKRKRKEDPTADRKGKGGKPIMVSNKIEEEKNKDHEHSMIRSQLQTIQSAANRLNKKMGGEHDVEEAKGPCWTGYKQVGMKKKGKKIVPNCVPEETDLEEENKPTNPALWAKWKAKAKAKFDVYPSAYANGWAAKGYKSAGGGWKSVKEETIEDLNGNTFAEVIDLIVNEDSDEERYCKKCKKMEKRSECKYGPKTWDKMTDDSDEMEESVRMPSRNGNIIMANLTWKGKYYSIKFFFPYMKVPSRQEIQGEIDKVYPGSKVYSYQISDYQPGQPLIYVSEDWQSVNRKDKTDGLSQKAVNAYRKENPGSKLQTAVTEKNPEGKRAKRRKNFCSRMSGMKKRLTSSETARDPDSRINKALRRWNCN